MPPLSRLALCGEHLQHTGIGTGHRAQRSVCILSSKWIGFRDQVNARIDPRSRRIVFRSRSLFGLFDWSKNRARKAGFAICFQMQTPP
jgi:uncharacterized protein (DUF1499 family)